MVAVVVVVAVGVGVAVAVAVVVVGAVVVGVGVGVAVGVGVVVGVGVAVTVTVGVIHASHYQKLLAEENNRSQSMIIVNDTTLIWTLEDTRSIAERMADVARRMEKLRKRGVQ